MEEKVGAKSRGNFKIEFCIKSDCKNRKTKCKECIRYSEYESTTNKSK